MRLDKYVTVALQLSRSNARQIIKNKQIKVNEKIVTKNDFYLNENDRVYYNNIEIEYKEFIYIMMNKPQGFLSSTFDTKQKTIFDLLEEYDVSKLFMVGRLDIDTEGLIIITNDGKLCHELTSPKKECEKRYYMEVDKEFCEDDVVSLLEGTTIYETTDKPYKCKSAKLIINKDDMTKAEIVITEGKYHQIKKMCKSVGKEVLFLKRISIGDLVLDEALKPGEYRELKEEEINILKK